MSETVFIYALVSSRDGFRLPWYVGQSVDTEHRLKDHLHECHIFKTRQAEWTRGERNAGFQVEVRLLEETTKETAHEREEYWIGRMREVNPELRNSTNGNAHRNRKETLLKRQAEQRRKLAEDAEWLAEVTKEAV